MLLLLGAFSGCCAGWLAADLGAAADDDDVDDTGCCCCWVLEPNFFPFGLLLLLLAQQREKHAHNSSKQHRRARDKHLSRHGTVHDKGFLVWKIIISIISTFKSKQNSDFTVLEYNYETKIFLYCILSSLLTL